MERDTPVGATWRWGLLAGGVVAVVLLVVVAFLASSAVQSWLAGVLATVVSGGLTAEIQRVMKARREQQAKLAPPVVVTVESKSGDFVCVQNSSGTQDFVPASGQCLRMLVEATDTRTTVLQRLHVLIVSAETLPAGASLMPSAGLLEPRPFEVTLDDPHPQVRPRNSSVDFPFSVSPGDPEVIDLVAYTKKKDVRWRLVLAWTCQGRRGNTTVDFSGRPIRTVPAPR